MSKHQILTALKTIYPHCRHYMARSPDQVREFLSGYLQVLERAFGDLDTRHEVGEWVEKVCNNWLDTLTDHDHKFPTPDQIRDRARAYQPRDKSANNQPWRELDKGAYNDLTLSEKARHCQILANKYRGMAGPMHHKGKQEGPVYPDRWAKFMPLAEKCQAEADLLNKRLSQARAAKSLPGIPPMEQVIDLVFER